jgi:hypothetical protein
MVLLSILRRFAVDMQGVRLLNMPVRLVEVLAFAD